METSLLRLNARGGIWKYINRLWGEFLIQSWNLEVGNGQKIKFRTDLWIGDESLKMKVPNLFNYAVNEAGK